MTSFLDLPPELMRDIIEKSRHDNRVSAKRALFSKQAHKSRQNDVNAAKNVFKNTHATMIQRAYRRHRGRVGTLKTVLTLNENEEFVDVSHSIHPQRARGRYVKSPGVVPPFQQYANGLPKHGFMIKLRAQGLVKATWKDFAGNAWLWTFEEPRTWVKGADGKWHIDEHYRIAWERKWIGVDGRWIKNNVPPPPKEPRKWVKGADGKWHVDEKYIAWERRHEREPPIVLLIKKDDFHRRFDAAPIHRVPQLRVRKYQQKRLFGATRYGFPSTDVLMDWAAHGMLRLIWESRVRDGMYSTTECKSYVTGVDASVPLPALRLSPWVCYD